LIKPPWTLPLASWTKRQNTMGEPWGFDLTSEPHLLSAKPVTVGVWMAKRRK